jgi:malic enzyme/metal-sulfur cluster biosynthetic enzyme
MDEVRQEAGLPTKEQVLEALKVVYDPEIPVNIVDLGLVYDVEVHENGVVDITMTLTAIGCPAQDVVKADAEMAVMRLGTWSPTSRASSSSGFPSSTRTRPSPRRSEKLTLYTAVGGVGPDKTLPVELDVGTDREDLLKDPLYLGVRHKRLKGEAYYRFLDRFVEAVKKRYPKALIQWEDFGKEAAFNVLERYRKVIPSFNDDIQGTGAVALAGVLSACRLKGERLSEQVVVVYGAGAGGIGVAWALVEGMKREGLSAEEARARVLVLDSKGLLVEGRAMEDYKKPFAQRAERIAGWRFSGAYPNLLETVENARATVLLGLSGQAGSFTEPVVRAMLENTPSPVIFPLSNPTSATEALPDDLIYWTEGKALVAAGSPFPPVGFMGRTIPVGQGNNAFIFPGLGLGAVLSRAPEARGPGPGGGLSGACGSRGLPAPGVPLGGQEGRSQALARAPLLRRRQGAGGGPSRPGRAGGPPGERGRRGPGPPGGEDDPPLPGGAPGGGGP